MQLLRIVKRFLFIFIINIQAAPLKIACIGDSITRGWSPVINESTWDEEGNFQNFFSSHFSYLSYPKGLAYQLGPSFEVHNYGAPGHTALKGTQAKPSYWDSEHLPAAKKFAADIYIIQLGTNDSSKHISSSIRKNFIEHYKKLIEEFVNLDTTKHVFICLPPPLYEHPFDLSHEHLGTSEQQYNADNPAIIPAINQLYTMLKKQYEDKIHLIDNFNFFAKKDVKALFFDGVHLDEYGYSMLAYNIFEHINSVLHFTPHSASTCNNLVNQHTVLPGHWAGSLPDLTQWQQYGCSNNLANAVYNRGRICPTVLKYQNSINHAARNAAERYNIFNLCDTKYGVTWQAATNKLPYHYLLK